MSKISRPHRRKVSQRKDLRRNRRFYESGTTLSDSNGAEIEPLDNPVGEEVQASDSKWVSTKVILFFLLLITAGFMLPSLSRGQAGLQDALFGSGILLWVVGVFGAVYCIVRRIAGPKAAKLAVAALFLILLSELFSKRDDKDHDDSFDGDDPPYERHREPFENRHDPFDGHRDLLERHHAPFERQ